MTKNVEFTLMTFKKFPFTKRPKLVVGFSAETENLLKNTKQTSLKGVLVSYQVIKNNAFLQT